MPLRCLLLLLACNIAGCSSTHLHALGNARINSLDELSIDSLRSRDYDSTIHIEEAVPTTGFKSYLASYRSDGLQVYTRIDVPETPEPDAGFPVVIFIHGWRGIDDAPSLDFYYDPESYYYKTIEGYRKAGFIVFTPGLRGHGTVNGKPAEGIEYMAAWDNGSYLSPVFYAIDVLNLLEGLDSLRVANIDTQRINLSGHSQGGDTALFVLAATGEGSRVRQQVNAASIWSGTFPPRFTQLQSYAPMQQTPQAFMSGDDTWTGRATAPDGSVNPHFIFGYPPDWIETVNVDEWTWQNESWAVSSVGEVLRSKLDQMYDAINQGVDDIDNATYILSVNESSKATIRHDPRVKLAMSNIDVFGKAQYLTEPLALQYSDQDFYSFPLWNEQLCEQMSKAGNPCYEFEYAQNTHSLDVSKHRWFSGEHVQAGWPLALRRDIALFSGINPTTVTR